MATLEDRIEQTMTQLFAQLENLIDNCENPVSLDQISASFFMTYIASHEVLITDLQTEIAELRQERQPCNKK